MKAYMKDTSSVISGSKSQGVGGVWWVREGGTCVVCVVYIGVVVVECMILFCMDGMYVLYVVSVCVWHLCVECGVCMVCVVYKWWMCLSVCSRCGICVGILLYMPCVYAPPMMYVCMPPMYGVCVLYVLPWCGVGVWQTGGECVIYMCGVCGVCGVCMSYLYGLSWCV